jgi:hypothetical protein
MAGAVFADLNDKISFCFESPNTEPAKHRRGDLVSVLYLLRRELIETAGYDPNTDTESVVDATGVRNRLFASLILMFTAFDLLAKLHLGDAGGVGARFKEFLKSTEMAEMEPEHADLFYAIRNSLVHAFGVPDSDSLQKLGLKSVALVQRKEFIVDGKVQGLYTVSNQGDVAIIYVDGLFRTLYWTIERFQETLFGTSTEENRKRFEEMFDKYGTMHWS